jgi:hypothetical protein
MRASLAATTAFGIVLSWAGVSALGALTISDLGVRDDFETNTAGNAPAGWDTSQFTGTNSALIQNDGDAHGNYLAIRIGTTGGAPHAILHFGDGASQVPPGRFHRGIIEADFRLVERPAAFGTFRALGMRANFPTNGVNNANLEAAHIYGDDWTGNGTITRLHPFPVGQFTLQTDVWYRLRIHFIGNPDPMVANDGVSRGHWVASILDLGLISQPFPFIESGQSYDLPYGTQVNEILMGNWFSQGVGFDIDNVMLIPEPAGAIACVGIGLLGLRRHGRLRRE